MDIDEILDNEDWDRVSVIQVMMTCGWYTADGKVRNDKVNQSFDTWFDALKGCIQVASE